MIQEIKRPITFKQLEFWAATTAYIISVYILAYYQFMRISRPDEYFYTPNLDFYRQHNLYFSYPVNYAIPQFFINTVYYCSFLFLSWGVEKSVKNWQTWKTATLNIVLIIGLGLAIYVFVALSLSIADTWKQAYLFYGHTQSEVYSIIFDQDFVFVIMLMIGYCAYVIIKYILKYMVDSFYIGYKKIDINNKWESSGQVKRECITAFIIWALWFILFSHRTNREFAVFFSCVILVAIGLYWYSFQILIPRLLTRKKAFREYMMNIAQILLVSIVPVTIITGAWLDYRPESGPVFDAALGANIFTIGFNLFFTAPLTWALYQYRLEKKEELLGLKTALGQSTADLDFLRSQINPHFLFNALNTLYGTALQEKAERTGEGIQRLGDMMRFMLQENHEDKILLTREMEYLQNYVDLQKLRTQTSPDIIINTEIDNQPNGLKIAPMLLIPFIENAFKHGISLREPSHIKISLHINDKQLLFDVTNSIHIKPDNDPEKGKSGIGLENVKQRLLLLYPDSHELIIHQNSREFFIHLSVTL